MATTTPKRFYKDVSIASDGNKFLIHLDGRALKTPGKQTLCVTDQNVAHIIAAEWDAQGDQIKPENMPVTRLVNVAIELTPTNRPKLIEETKSYAGTDLLCYRAREPESLVKRQNFLWDPVLDWARDLGINLTSTNSVIAIEQDPKSLQAVGDYAETLNDVHLTLLVHLTAVFGSAILAMAVMQKHLTGSQAFELSRLDNLWQIEHWGEDDEARDNAKNLAAEVKALCKIIGV